MPNRTMAIALVGMFSVVGHAAIHSETSATVCRKDTVGFPCKARAWGIGIDGHYLKSQYNQFSAINDYSASYGWGLRVAGSYHFNTGNAISLNWDHYNRDTGFRQSRLLRTKFDVINLEVDQLIDVGEVVVLHLQGGIQYAKLIDDGVGGTISTSDYRNTGFGPRIGSRLAYDFGNGFSAYGEGNVALLAMSRSDRAASIGSLTGTTLGSDQSFGVSYTQSAGSGQLTGHLGWRALQWDGGNALGSNAWNGFFMGMKWVGDP